MRVARLVAAALGFVVATMGTLAAASASAAPAAANVAVAIGASPTPVPSRAVMRPTPNGGSTSIGSLRFFVMPQAWNVGPDAATFLVRFELAPGMRFETGQPDVDAESCSATETVAECRVTDPLPADGASVAGWQYVIVAERAGSYTMNAEILDLTTADPDSADNTTTITVVLSGSSGGGGGGSVAVSASAAKLTPSRPKAGSVVTATVQVRAGSAPIRPTRVSCGATIGSAKLKGRPRADSGTARCTFRTPPAARGKLLRGSVSFTARGERLTKRFSVRLR